MATQGVNTLFVDCPSVPHWYGEQKYKTGTAAKNAFLNLCDNPPKCLRDHHAKITVRARLKCTDKIVPSKIVDSFDKTVEL